jgi:hypothetical protein
MSLLAELRRAAHIWLLRRAIRRKDRQIARLRRQTLEVLNKLQFLSPRGRGRGLS